jgi:hypothetical protein
MLWPCLRCGVAHSWLGSQPKSLASNRADRSPATCSEGDQSRIALAECFLGRASPGGNVARSAIAVADLFVSCTDRPPLPDLRCDAIGCRIFSRPFPHGISMEPARIRFLLLIVDLQHLRLRRYHHALATPAHSATDPEREDIYSRLHHRAFRPELGLSFADESAFVAGAWPSRGRSTSRHPERKRQSGSDRGIPSKLSLRFRGRVPRLSLGMSDGNYGFVRPTSSSGAPRCFAMKSLGFSQPSVFSR